MTEIDDFDLETCILDETGTYKHRSKGTGKIKLLYFQTNM